MTMPTLRTTQRQQHTVTPRLQHAVRLLQLSSLDFAQEVHEAMGRNPFLEAEDGAAGPLDADERLAPSHATDGLAASADPAGDAADGSGSSGELRLEPRDGVADDGADERDGWQYSPGPGRKDGSEGDGEISALDMMAASVGLRQHLRSQLSVLVLSPRDHALGCAIVESLDDDGYLRTPLEEIASTSGMAPAVDEIEMAIALKRVQALDPMGVAARSVSECLTLQLDAVEDAAERELARVILADHMQRLAQNDLNGMARALKQPASSIEKVCDRIRRLNPRPGWNVEPPETHYITPDVLVRKSRGNWHVSLNRAIVPRVRINQTYAALFQRHRSATHAELAQHLQDARWTVRNVEQRFSTILMVAEAILKRQRHFLEFGPMAMKPLGLREIAEELGLHESTVSRVTNNKYMATPVGVFELKFFFSREMATANGGACSATAIRGVIKEMLDAENAAHPLSDAQIARLLARQGLKVARRTVTKYRQLLKVPAVDRRRRAA